MIDIFRYFFKKNQIAIFLFSLISPLTFPLDLRAQIRTITSPRETIFEGKKKETREEWSLREPETGAGDEIHPHCRRLDGAFVSLSFSLLFFFCVLLYFGSLLLPPSPLAFLTVRVPPQSQRTGEILRKVCTPPRPRRVWRLFQRFIKLHYAPVGYISFSRPNGLSGPQAKTSQRLVSK